MPLPYALRFYLSIYESVIQDLCKWPISKFLKVSYNDPMLHYSEAFKFKFKFILLLILWLEQILISAG